MKANPNMSSNPKQEGPRDPTSSIISVICDTYTGGCGRPYQLEGSYDPKTYNLRLFYAMCPHCGHERNESVVDEGYFRCAPPPRGCNVVYRRRKNWNPAKGLCMCCYMRFYRKKKKVERESKKAVAK